MALIDPAFRPAPLPNTVRLGLVSVAAEPKILAALGAALAHAEATLVPVELSSFEAAFSAGLTIIGAETWAAFGRLIDSPALGADVRARLLAARDISHEALVAAEACRATICTEIDAALESVDALVLPTMPEVPPTLAAAADARAALRMTALVRPFNLSGHPALSVPLVTDEGLPVGLQLVGHRNADAALCALARRLTQTMNPMQNIFNRSSSCTQ
jgi:amidase